MDVEFCQMLSPCLLIGLYGFLLLLFLLLLWYITLICIYLTNCMQVRKQQLELDMEQQTGKGVRQGCILSPCLFNLYAEYIMRNTGLEETQLESRLPGEISITSGMQMTPPLWQKVKRN